MYIKYKSMENEIVNALVENNGEDLVASHMQGMLHDSYSEQFISDFINAFEDTKKKKTASRKKKTDMMEVEDGDEDTLTGTN